MELGEDDLAECYPATYGKKSHRAVIGGMSIAIVLLCFIIFFIVRYPSTWLGQNRPIGPNSPYKLTPTTEII